MKAIKPRYMYVAAIVVVVSLLVWVAALFIVYVADDWVVPAASERSVPPPRTY